MPKVHSGSLLLTNSVANRVLIPLLKSRAGKSWAGRRLGHGLAVVKYVGHRSGQRRQLVTQYTNDGQAIRIQIGMAERKTWWRNFRDTQPLRLRLAGHDHAATAHVVRDGNQVSVIAELDDNPASETP